MLTAITLFVINVEHLARGSSKQHSVENPIQLSLKNNNNYEEQSEKCGKLLRCTLQSGLFSNKISFHWFTDLPKRHRQPATFFEKLAS